MKIQTIIIGKESNLSKALLKKVDDLIVISARDILKDISVLSVFYDKKINIIFNNFQSATQLNEIISAESYILNAISVTAKVLDFCKNMNIKIYKIIYTSSSSVYGNNILCNEKDELKPLNLHASLKFANEKLIEKFCTENNIDYTITRVFNMYGGDDKFSIISKIIQCFRNDTKLTVVNNGNAVRDFIYINDVVDIYIKLLSVKNINIVNIGTGKGSSIKSIFDLLKNHNISIKMDNIFRDEVKISTADTNLLEKMIGKIYFTEVESYLKEELKI
ncbi:NAD-dependent epimerase/dehydratase family protein [Aliarcobacter butzleri]|uniref:NAD-dependent epimerase/dehydratase family protein n=1 Tax=Aliarcobacter butzleri TaxID=28197 RepID=UPI003AF4C673